MYSENSWGLLKAAVKLVWSKFASWNGSLKAHAKKKLFFEKYSIFQIFYFEWIATLFLIGKRDFSLCSISLIVHKNINLHEYPRFTYLLQYNLIYNTYSKWNNCYFNFIYSIKVWNYIKNLHLLIQELLT